MAANLGARCPACQSFNTAHRPVTDPGFQVCEQCDTQLFWWHWTYTLVIY